MCYHAYDRPRQAEVAGNCGMPKSAGRFIVRTVRHVTPSPYTKPFLTVEQQVGTLQSRGLLVPDSQAAAAFLRGFNYYRFRAYCYRFEVCPHPHHTFAKGTTFADIVALCTLDEDLTFLLARALRWMEIDFRTRLAYQLARATHSAFPQLDPSLFWRGPDWLSGDTLGALRRDAEDKLRRKVADQQIAHLEEQYAEFPDLPIWAAVEVTSLGTLSRLYAALWPGVKKLIARTYGVPAHFLRSWLHHLTDVRNQCAHHGRVWDYRFSASVDLPREWVPAPPAQSVFASILCLHTLIVSLDAERAAAWRNEVTQRVYSYLQRCPQPRAFAAHIGLPEGWQDHPGWRGIRDPYVTTRDNSGWR